MKLRPFPFAVFCVALGFCWLLFAQQIFPTFNLSVRNGYIQDNLSGSQAVTQNTVNPGKSGGILVVTTNGTAIPLLSITTPGWCRVLNTDSNNFCTIGPSNGSYVPFIKLKPGEFALFRYFTNAPTAQAGFVPGGITNSIKLQFDIYDD